MSADVVGLARVSARVVRPLSYQRVVAPPRSQLVHPLHHCRKPFMCANAVAGRRRWRSHSTNGSAGYPKSISEEIRDIHAGFRHAGSAPYKRVPGEDDGLVVIPLDEYLARRAHVRMPGVYAIYAQDGELQYIGHAEDVCAALKAHRVRVGCRRSAAARVLVMEEESAGTGSLGQRSRALQAAEWIEGAASLPPGNEQGRDDWTLDIADRTERSPEAGIGEGEAARGVDATVYPTASPFMQTMVHRKVGASAGASQTQPLTVEAVDAALEEVRPFLVADGGDVAVTEVTADGRIVLEFVGACASCPSSGATMSMGVEQCLRMAFGDAITAIDLIDARAGRGPESVTFEQVDRHLDAIRGAIASLRGSVTVERVDAEGCRLRYCGPQPIAKGVRDALRERFPMLQSITIVDASTGTVLPL